MKTPASPASPAHAPRTIGREAWAALSPENRVGIVAFIEKVAALPPHLNDYLHYPALGLQAIENLSHEVATLRAALTTSETQAAELRKELGRAERLNAILSTSNSQLTSELSEAVEYGKAGWAQAAGLKQELAEANGKVSYFTEPGTRWTAARRELYFSHLLTNKESERVSGRIHKKLASQAAPAPSPCSPGSCATCEKKAGEGLGQVPWLPQSKCHGCGLPSHVARCRDSECPMKPGAAAATQGKEGGA